MKIADKSLHNTGVNKVLPEPEHATAPQSRQTEKRTRLLARIIAEDAALLKRLGR